ncbi:hypothetical protein GCM10011368_29290 [Hyunsoonleella pacifica]|nr:hypothetical protein GCM10011368_29290 [Hyunsoonleella pacifica]
MPSLEAVTTSILNAGLVLKNTDTYFIKPDLEDQFLYCGKNNPEFYFNEQIRHGISSFSHLSNKTEVEQGLEQLREDISNDTIKDVMQSYNNDLGDYLYIITEKT